MWYLYKNSGGSGERCRSRTPSQIVYGDAGTWSERFQDDFPTGGKLITVEKSPLNLGVLEVSPKADSLMHHKNEFVEDHTHNDKPPY